MKASTLVFTFLLCCPLIAQDGPNRTRPNVILIMADDMGYEALSSNGSESCKSPNLDKLAAEGVLYQLLLQPDLHPLTRQDHDRSVQRPKLREIRNAGSRTDHLCASTQGSKVIRLLLPANGNWARRRMLPSTLALKNHACGNTPVAVVPKRMERPLIAASSTQC